MQTIIVGMDGSSCAEAALEWAAEEASVRNAKLRAVAVWEIGPTPVERFPTLDLIEAYRSGADEAVRAAEEYLDSDWPELDGTAETWEGNPADVLISLASASDLLVVGNRGRGDVASLVLGSVSHHVVQHASCPVVVIPQLWTATDRRNELHDQTAV
jgi:nucleotide-binding universal stress UspA family protein